MIVESKDFVRSSLKDFLSDITSDNVEERYRFLSYYEGMAQEMEKDLAKYFPIKSLEVPMIVHVTLKLDLIMRSPSLAPRILWIFQLHLELMMPCSMGEI